MEPHLIPMAQPCEEIGGLAAVPLRERVASSARALRPVRKQASPGLRRSRGRRA